MEHTSEKHVIGYGSYLLIWLILLALTSLTVAAAGIDLKGYTLVLAMSIAAIKSALVISYFMHIKYDQPIFRIFVVVALLTLAIVFVLTAFDVFFTRL